MSSRKKAILSWSGGKDAALALQKTLFENSYEVVALLSTVEAETSMSSGHSIHVDLLIRQAESIGIPLHIVPVERKSADYESKMLEAVGYFKLQDVTHFIFGDIYLSDIRSYREKLFHPLGVEVVEPLWGKTPNDVMTEFIQSGIKSKIIITEADKLGKTFIGQDLDKSIVDLFPANVDVCGENGEYHTFSYAGGLFKKEVKFSISGVSKVSQTIGLKNGEVKTIEHWQAELTP